MAFKDFLKTLTNKKQENVGPVNPLPFNTVSKGSQGTEIFGGYIFEEYLEDIRGYKWAEIADRMRRSDPIVTMAINALTLPLLSQNWFIEKLEESEEAEWQKKLFDKVVFEDMSDSFTKTLAEILTFWLYGYSVFEKIHGVSFDPEIGLYNTIKKLAYRSQKTIERWNVDKDGKLQSVYQQAYGDTGKTINIDARFLVHFCPNMEGDNFEGISKIRPAYGPWLRKNEFLKLLAAGLEKYAIPTPVLEVPEGKENGQEFQNAINALECYTSNQSQYLTYPEGWKLEINPVNFDADKIRKIIDSENQEIVNAVMASFLLLGQNGGGGSYALSSDLSDFFAQTLQAGADHITEVFSKKIMQDVLNLNRPNMKLKVALRCDSLRDRADMEFANTLKAFIDSGVVKTDDALDTFIREKYRFPKKEEVEINDDSGVENITPIGGDNIQQQVMNGAQIASLVQVVQSVAAGMLPRESGVRIIETAFQVSSDEANKLMANAGQGFKIEQAPEKVAFSEGVLSFAEKKSQKTPKLIDELAENLKAYTSGYLLVMSGDFISSLEKAMGQSRNIYQASLKVDDPKTAIHKKIVEYLLARYIVEAKKELAKDTNIKLSEVISLSDSQIDELFEEFLKLKDILDKNPLDNATRLKMKKLESEIAAIATKDREKLNASLSQIDRDKIRARAGVLVDTQSSDVYKQINLTAQQNGSLPVNEMLFEVSKKAQELASGPIAVTGPDILASTTINDARLDFVDEEEIPVESYTYVAEMDDRTTDLCRELNDKTFSVNDPDFEKYTIPNHHNCRSYWQFNFVGDKNPKITGIGELTKKAQSQINLSEKKCCDHDFKNPFRS